VVEAFDYMLLVNAGSFMGRLFYAGKYIWRLP